MKKSIDHIDLDEIVFEGRNKDYGAYQLRKGYKKRFWMSLLLAIILIVCIALLLNIKRKDYLPSPPKMIKTTEVHIKEYRMPKKHFPKISDKEQSQKKELLVKSKKTDNQPHFTNKQSIRRKIIDNTTISTQKMDGINLNIKPFKQTDSIKSFHLNTAHIEEIINEIAITKVQSIPHYPGGDSAWYRYLRQHLNIKKVLNNGAIPATYTAVIAFIVHTDSSTSNFKVVKDGGYGTGEEALKVVRASGKWIPGKKNGKPITFAQLQTIIFKVNN